jgi:hypothetical protein
MSNTTAQPAKPASEKSINYLVSLAAKRTPHVAETTIREWAATAGQAEVSKRIDWIKGQPVVAQAPAASNGSSKRTEEPADGIYVNKDDDGNQVIFKVYKAVHGSGRQCVKRLEHTVHPEGHVLAGNPKGQFVYMGLAAKHLPAEARALTLEEAQKFGKIYGFCGRCGRTLTDDDSIAAGIGPVCAGRWA